jgi:hypothetical protein
MWGESMDDKRCAGKRLEGIVTGFSKILFILKTRKIYGYNSVMERIFWYLFRDRRKISSARNTQPVNADHRM